MLLSTLPRVLNMDLNCKLCGRVCKSKISLGTHVKQFHKIDTQNYIIQIKYSGINPVCKCGCGKETKYGKSIMDFSNFIRGHRTKEIQDKMTQAMKESFEKKYGQGITSPFQLKDVIDGIQEIRRQKMPEIVKQQQATIIERYGVNHHLQIGLINKPNPFTIDKVKEKIKNTMLQRYGVDNPIKSERFFKMAQEKCAASCRLSHWRTGEEIVCRASYELAVVNYLNSNKIDFRWQVPFKTPHGTYYVDLYLTDKNLYVEIKGYFRQNISKLKWLWFHENNKNSELWDLKKLKELNIL